MLFRDANGGIAALADRCPHRFAPLRLGRIRGDAVECGYHGLQFDASGACVHNPHGATPTSANCRVKSYPVVERHGAIWIWPGEPRLADAESIPDFSYLTAPGRKTIFGGTRLKAHYELISDNLMDASHTQYVHMDLLGTDAFRNSRHEVIQDGDIVNSNYLIPGGVVPAAFEDYFDGADLRVDYAIRFRWSPPALVRNHVSVTPVDDASRGIQRIGSHFMTPETETMTHYFFAHTRDFALDDSEADERSRRWQRLGLTLQDGPMIEAVQETMGTSDLNALHPFLFSIDAAAVRVRRVLARLIDAER